VQQYTLTNPGVFLPNATPEQLLAEVLAAAGTTPVSQTTYGIAKDLRVPYSLQSAITVERQLPKNTTVSESFLHTRGQHELREQDINAPGLPTYDGKPGPVLLMESNGIFNQNQLITNVRTQPTSKISLNGFYMYGHANSNTDGVGTLAASPYSMAGEYGPSSLDVHHRAFLGGSITTKWDFRLSPFVVINSGAPFNITTGTDPYDTTLYTARPGLVTDPSLVPAGTTLIPTVYGLLDPNPKPNAPGEVVLPRNFGRSPGSVSVNLRLAKTFGFGPSRESSSNSQQGGGPGGPGGGGRGGGGHGGPPGGMMGGPMGGMFGNPTTGKRYNLTFSVQARNLLNHVNPGPINGVLGTPLFGESNSLGGGFGAFAQNGNNRRLELQARFQF
jgi:hypothetical protein